jgi:hypothetical protein
MVKFLRFAAVAFILTTYYIDLDSVPGALKTPVKRIQLAVGKIVHAITTFDLEQLTS